MRENRFANPRILFEISYVSTKSEKQNASFINTLQVAIRELPLANLLIFFKCDANLKKKVQNILTRQRELFFD